MKALWLCNILLPHIAGQLGDGKVPVAGWISGQLDCIKEYGLKPELTVVCPYQSELSGTTEDFKYYTFSNRSLTKYNKQLKNRFAEILAKEKVDIIHIFGTEYPHTLSMLEAATEVGLKDKTVVHIQGLMSVCEKHYYGDMPLSYRYGMTPADILRAGNVVLERRKAKKRGGFEKKALKLTSAVAGRTEWDKACTGLINPELEYYHCREILRKPFYENKWSYENCRKHTIFFSQPISYVKAFYLLLRVFPEVLKKYPDAKIVTTGDLFPKDLKNKLKQSWYLRSMRRFIEKNGLKEHIEFKGRLNENEMLAEYLSANVFVMTSTIENSPNSLGEAMLLGVPSVAGDVGGIAELMTPFEEGLVYPKDEDYMLLWYILRLFEDEGLCRTLSEKTRKRALINHSKQANAEEIRQMYSKIVGKEL